MKADRKIHRQPIMPRNQTDGQRNGDTLVDPKRADRLLRKFSWEKEGDRP